MEHGPVALRWTQNDVKRFMQYVMKHPSGCWIWVGGKSRGKGNKLWYGTFRCLSGVVRAHRFACEAIGWMGELPEGYDRDHKCGFSLCVNPDHLQYVTKKQNQELKMKRRV